MLAIENTLFPIVVKFNEYLSNYILVFLLIGVGLWYSVKTRFVQIRCFFEGFKNLFSSSPASENKSEKSMNSFQALSTAIAGQVGTGNIIGASGAILIGGPGVLFWMWIIAFLGMATIYAEASLALKTSSTDEEGNIKGGPVYYITTAFNGKFGKFLSNFFAVACILALGFMGCMVQANSISNSLQEAFKIPSWQVGIVLVIICSLIYIGGIKRLASIVEKIVPFMSILFIVGSLCILIIRIEHIPETFYLIFKYAFHPQAILGGTFWYAISATISQGAKRGLFSNEAGMGSTPHAHALVRDKTPHEQGTVAMIGVFVDTFVILTLNALVIISTLYTSGNILANGYTEAVIDILNKTNLVQSAFSSVFDSSVGAMFVAVCLVLFAFSTILSWNLFGKINSLYLFKNKRPKKVILVYSLLALTFTMLGTLISSDFVWELTDMFNNLIVIPNVIALFALTNLVLSCMKNKNQ